MAEIELLCKYCNSESVKFAGYHYNLLGRKQRCICQCCGKKFQTEYSYHAYETDTRSKILPMLENGSGIRDISRVLHIGTETVLNEVKKETDSIK